MRIAMIGSGYVGLASGACLMDFGRVLACGDPSVKNISTLKGGSMTISASGLDVIVAKNAEPDHRRFTTDLAEEARLANVPFVATANSSCSRHLKRISASRADSKLIDICNVYGRTNSNSTPEAVHPGELQ